MTVTTTNTTTTAKFNSIYEYILDHKKEIKEYEYKEVIKNDPSFVYELIERGQFLSLPDDCINEHKIYLDFVHNIWRSWEDRLKEIKKDFLEDRLSFERAKSIIHFLTKVKLPSKKEAEGIDKVFLVTKAQIEQALTSAILANLRYNFLQMRVEYKNGKKVKKGYFNKFLKAVDISGFAAADFWEQIIDMVRFYPSKKWYSELEWDQENRLDYLVEEVLGIKDEFQKKLVLVCMKSALERWGTPGAKNDNVLILQGDQGARKSSFIQAIAPLNSYISTSNFETKDHLFSLHRKLLVEFGEIASITTKKDTDIVKEFISKQEDNFRVPYGEMDDDYPRAFSCWGSVNDVDFLKDLTGSRRWFIVNIPSGHIIDCDWVKVNCDQLWAEIKELDIKPYLDEDDSKTLEKRNENYYPEDELKDKLEALFTENNVNFEKGYVSFTSEEVDNFSDYKKSNLVYDKGFWFLPLKTFSIWCFLQNLDVHTIQDKRYTKRLVPYLRDIYKLELSDNKLYIGGKAYRVYRQPVLNP